MRYLLRQEPFKFYRMSLCRYIQNLPLYVQILSIFNFWRSRAGGQGSTICYALFVSDIMSDMKTVTLRSLRRDAALLDVAAEGEEVVVTRFGKPYVRIIPAKQPRSFLGSGTHLRQKAPVSSDPIPVSEWKGMR